MGVTRSHMWWRQGRGKPPSKTKGLLMLTFVRTSHLTVLKLATLALRTLRVLELRAFRPSHAPSAPLRTFGARTPLLEDLRSSQTPVLRTVVLRSVVPPKAISTTVHCAGFVSCRLFRPMTLRPGGSNFALMGMLFPRISDRSLSGALQPVCPTPLTPPAPLSARDPSPPARGSPFPRHRSASRGRGSPRSLRRCSM